MVHLHTKVDKIVNQLESLLDDIGGVAEVDYRLAFWSLANGLNDVIDALALPPVSGGSPEADDDWEDLCPEFLADPEGWPEAFDAECDAVFYNLAPDHEGPLPLSVLAESAPAWEPRAEDWSDLVAWDASPYSEADQVTAHGCA